MKYRHNRKRRMIRVGFLVLSIIFIAGVVLFTIKGITKKEVVKSPEQVLKSYMNCICQKNYSEKTNIKYFESVFYDDIVRKEEKLRKNVVKYPELKEYRKGGNRHTNKLPIWVTFSYTEFGTMSMMYNYLRGDLRKGVLTYLFHEKRYSKGDTELVDTWLDGVRNLRNYCAHNSMVVGLKSSIVLRHQKDAENLLPKNNDLYSRLYALKKLLSVEDAKSMKKDLVKLIKKSSVDIYTLKIFPEQWEMLYDEISEF